MRSNVSVELDDFIYLKPLKKLLDPRVELFVDDSSKIDRLSQDGLITAFGTINGVSVGVIYQDFRVHGASISKENAKRMIDFLDLLKLQGRPLIFLMNSLGVRITQGRSIFDDAFSVIPALFDFKKHAPLITAAIGGTIGISAIYFAQGHYRLATNKSVINLAGPEVHRRFFGDRNLTYSNFASAEFQYKVNTLVHEKFDETPALLERIKEIVTYLSNQIADPLRSEVKPQTPFEELLKNLGEEVKELFPNKGPEVRVFVGKFGSQLVGYFLNPLNRPNNLLTVAGINKAMAAIDLFKTLKMPIISIADSPGGDPRQGESDADGMMKLTDFVKMMIDYPHPKMGIIHGRCFGGMGMMLFPRIFGGSKLLAVKGAQVGIMNESIIKELLASTPRLFQEWSIAHEAETPDLQDLLSEGTIQKVIYKEEIMLEIKLFLLENLLIDMKTDLGEVDLENIMLA